MMKYSTKELDEIADKLAYAPKKEQRTESYYKALYMQLLLLTYFAYVPDEEKFDGVRERFDHEAKKLINNEQFDGDCDTGARTLTEWARRTEFEKPSELIELVTPNHYIGGVVDREISDIWIVENTAWIYTKKALEIGVDSFESIDNLPTWAKFSNGFIEPLVVTLSDLQKGFKVPEVRTKYFMIGSRVKKYYMESFHTLDTLIIDWYINREDLPFLTNFRESWDIVPERAEFKAKKKREYTFTKEWEAETSLSNAVKVEGKLETNDFLDSLMYMISPKKKIALLIGHRQSKQGNRSVKGISEFSYWYTYLHTIKDFLPEHLEYKVFERLDSDGDGYRERMRAVGKRAEEWGAELIVSCHFNSVKSSKIEGHEVLCSKSSNSRGYAKMMVQAMEDELNRNSRGVKVIADDPELRGSGFLYKTPMPAILVEPFFGSNYDDWSMTQSGSFFRALSAFFYKI